jgi:hypothetical protein
MKKVISLETKVVCRQTGDFPILDKEEMCSIHGRCT